jgi:hypothetical protein
MLACMQKDWLDAWVILKGSDQRSNFHEVRTGSGNHNDSIFSIEAGVSDFV